MLKKIGFVLCIFLLTGSLSAQELLSSPEFHARATGFAGQQSDTYKVFADALAKGTQSRLLFRKCLQEGTPAAKLYGAIGLYQLDPEAGRRALLNLRANKSQVVFFHGCIKCHEQVGALASELLSKDGKTLSLRSFIDIDD